MANGVAVVSWVVARAMKTLRRIRDEGRRGSHQIWGKIKLCVLGKCLLIRLNFFFFQKKKKMFKKKR